MTFHAPVTKPYGVAPSPYMAQGAARGMWNGLAYIAPFQTPKGAGTSTLLDRFGHPLEGSNLSAGSNLRWRGTPYGLGVGGTAASTHLLFQDNFAPITTSDGAGTGDFTLLILANPVAEATIREAVSQTTGGAGPRVDILFNTAEDITASSGSICFLTTPSNAANRTSVAVAGPVDGNYHLFCARRSGSDLTLWVDGVLRATVTGTIRDVLGTGAGFAIGNRAESPSFPLNTDTNVVLSAGWNRALSNFEMLLLGVDPFYMFRPAPRQKIINTVAAGGTAVPVFMHHYMQQRGA